ncbi:GerAB/ArcD/ProY family transporter [Heyndrickxia sporothermodurans]|uniref:GerAB/ArcD/ProY family transporter n=1 Tax=Heyndrickxia sporothermodurans TaxID=46224 RepID=UPI002E215EED|nr:GerAB/ArcD/ProY family transporter [Heyndrickxia sporothermodurans]MED3652224.1 GerAB/ArcD/ProY family transporter [Heyndrickxia sporothermodurans]MED3698459.1 GerAB/ArcD/ProY family transporter [Heyndrickxia sporothermodurans]
MEKVKITPIQLFVLYVLFEHGSALVISLGTDAKQDAWLSILIGMLGGLFLYYIYYRLYQFYPGKPLTSYAQEIIGSFFGKLVAFLYILYFLYLSSRVLRDFGELLLTFAYPNSPLFIINTIMILAIMYAVHKGIEVLARTGELLFAFLYFFAITGFLLVIISGLIDLNQLKPILEEGIVRILDVAFKQTVYVPFGEMIAFTMILPYLNTPSKAKIVGFSAIILSGINLALTMAVNIAVNGINLVSRSPFPLLTTIQRIEVASFLERLDVFFMLAVIIGGFFKISVFFYVGLIGTADLFKLKNHKKLVFPIGLIILILSMSIASSFAEHMKEGLVIVPIYLHIPFQVIIPIMLLMVAFLKHFIQNKKKHNVSG